MIPIANPEFDDAEKDAVVDVLDSGMVADGKVVRSFEDEFATYCGTEHGIATSNGTTALHAALEALETVLARSPCAAERPPEVQSNASTVRCLLYGGEDQ